MSSFRLNRMRLRLVLSTVFLILGCQFLLAQDDWDAEMDVLAISLDEAVERTGKQQIAVLDFTDASGRQDALGHQLAEDLMFYMVQQKPLYTIVERRFLEKVLEEQRFSAQPIVDEARAIELGKLISADAIVFGTVRMNGRTATITSKLIDTETAAVLAMERSVVRVSRARSKAANDDVAPRRVGSNGVYKEKQTSSQPKGEERAYVPVELFMETGSLVLHNKPLPSIGVQGVFRHTRTSSYGKSTGAIAGTAWGAGVRYGHGIVDINRNDVFMGYREAIGNADDNFGIARRMNGEPISIGDVFLLDQDDPAFNYFVPNGFEAARVAHVRLENIRYSALQADLWYKVYLTPNHTYINVTKPYIGVGVAVTSILFSARYTGAEGLIQREGGTALEPEFGVITTPIDDRSFPFEGFGNHLTYFDWTLYLGLERGRFGFQIVGGISSKLGGSPLLLPYLSSVSVGDRSVQRDLEEQGFLNFENVLPEGAIPNAESITTEGPFEAQLSASLRLTFLLN